MTVLVKEMHCLADLILMGLAETNRCVQHQANRFRENVQQWKEVTLYSGNSLIMFAARILLFLKPTLQLVPS